MSSLKTQRLTLSPFDLNELDILHQLFTDPYIREYLWDDQLLPRSQSEDVLKVNQQLFKRNKWGLWKIQHSDNKEIMGFAGLWYFFEEPQPQLLYAILEKHAGQGYATEAAQRILSYAFEELNFTYLIAAMDEPHKISQKLAERIGMKFVEKKIEEGKATVFYRIDKEH